MILFCQLPAFSKQYAIRLEAHYLELQKVVEAFSLAVFKQGKTKHAQAQADYAEFLQQRVSRFKTSLDHIASSNPVLQPFWMFWGFDAEIVSETWRGFSPGLFFNVASVLWGVFGAIVGEGVLMSLARLFRGRNTAL